MLSSQLARSFGVFFTESESKGKRYFGAKIIPARGVWIEIESESDGAIYIRIAKKENFLRQRFSVPWVMVQTKQC